MASTIRMLAAGLSLAGNSFALVVFALGGGAVFTQIQIWYSSWHYASPPPIDPSIVQVVFPMFYAMLLILEAILVYAVYQTIYSKKTYYTDQGY
jgi:hypothetical protein